MVFKPGQSGNPSGRPAMSSEVKAAIKSNGAKAIERMTSLLAMDEVFTRYEANDQGEVEVVAGKFSPKEQLQLLQVAMDRALGKPTDLTVTHQHGGTVGVQARPTTRLADMADKLPERAAQARVIDAKALPIAEVDEAKAEPTRKRRRRG